MYKHTILSRSLIRPISYQDPIHIAFPLTSLTIEINIWCVYPRGNNNTMVIFVSTSISRLWVGYTACGIHCHLYCPVTRQVNVNHLRNISRPYNTFNKSMHFRYQSRNLGKGSVSHISKGEAEDAVQWQMNLDSKTVEERAEAVDVAQWLLSLAEEEAEQEVEGANRKQSQR